MALNGLLQGLFHVPGLFAVPIMARTNRPNEEDEAKVSRKFSLLMVALLLRLGAYCRRQAAEVHGVLRHRGLLQGLRATGGRGGGLGPDGPLLAAPELRQCCGQRAVAGGKAPWH